MVDTDPLAALLLSAECGIPNDGLVVHASAVYIAERLRAAGVQPPPPRRPRMPDMPPKWFIEACAHPNFPGGGSGQTIASYIWPAVVRNLQPTLTGTLAQVERDTEAELMGRAPNAPSPEWIPAGRGNEATRALAYTQDAPAVKVRMCFCGHAFAKDGCKECGHACWQDAGMWF
jgi:hypothetical protein